MLFRNAIISCNFIHDNGDDEEFAVCGFFRELAVGASHKTLFAIVASEPGERKLFCN